MLTLAQRTAEEHLASARQDAEKIRAEARTAGDQAAKEAQGHADSVRREADTDVQFVGGVIGPELAYQDAIGDELDGLAHGQDADQDDGGEESNKAERAATGHWCDTPEHVGGMTVMPTCRR